MTDLMVRAELDRLVELEATVDRGLTTFVDVGNALIEIRDSRLYRASYGTFEDYCQLRWGFSRHRASQLISAAGVVTNVTSQGLPAPANEGQARELARVPEDERAEVWERALESTGGKPTAAAIRQAAEPERLPGEQPLPLGIEDPLPEPIARQIEERLATKTGLTLADVRAATRELEQAAAPSPDDAQAMREMAARQEALAAWNQAHDGLLHALSYAKTWTPPEDTDIYVTVAQFAGRAEELAAIAAIWKENHGKK